MPKTSLYCVYFTGCVDIQATSEEDAQAQYIELRENGKLLKEASYIEIEEIEETEESA